MRDQRRSDYNRLLAGSLFYELDYDYRSDCKSKYFKYNDFSFIFSHPQDCFLGYNHFLGRNAVSVVI